MPQHEVVRGLWGELVDVAEDHWRWVLVVVPVAVFTVWSVVESASRLHTPPVVGTHVALLGSLSLLLGVIAMLCATAVYSEVSNGFEHGLLGLLAFAGLGVVMLVGVPMGIVAAQQGGDVTGLWIAVWAQFWSTVLTYVYAVSSWM